MNNSVIDVTIEIPKNSNIKYEYDRANGNIKVDRILYGANIYPENYGFIPNALDWDGDELDILVISDHSFLPGTIVPTRILGAMTMVDDGETDTKLIGVIDCDPRFKQINSINDIPEHKLSVIRNFFETYKILQKKQVKIGSFKDATWAQKELNECISLMKKYGKMPKEKFISLMMKKYPGKYNK